MSHWPNEALRLPVTGSSTSVPSLGKNARTSSAARRARRVEGDEADVQVDGAGSHGEHGLGRSSSRRAIHPGPLSTHSAATHGAGSRPSGRGDRDHDRVSTGPERTQRRRGEGQPAVDPADPDQPGRALLHARRRPSLGCAAVLEPGVARAERRVAGERQLGTGVKMRTR